MSATTLPGEQVQIADFGRGLEVLIATFTERREGKTAKIMPLCEGYDLKALQDYAETNKLNLSIEWKGIKR